MIRKVKSILGLFLVVTMVLSSVITAHAATYDSVAISYFNSHTANHSNECGAVIRTNGTLASVGYGTSSDVIGPLLDGLGIPRFQNGVNHEENIRDIAIDYGWDFTSFNNILNNYIQKYNLSYTPISGLVHCHPNSSGFSIQDQNLSRYFNVPVYVVTNSGKTLRKYYAGSDTVLATK